MSINNIQSKQHLNSGSGGTSSSTARNRLTSLDRIDEKEEQHINGVTGGTAGTITSSSDCDNKGVDVEGAAIVGPSGVDPSSGD